MLTQIPVGLPWSCDTLVALPDATRDHRTIFAKNSDRPTGEAQPIRYFPRRRSGARLRATNIDLDDGEIRWGHLGASPFWCWGHEYGLNEWGVAIGNEAIFTRDLAARKRAARAGDEPPPGLLGMDLVRLGLERACTAEEAVEVIGGLLEEHGQWGSGVLGEPALEGAYDNSFLIADNAEAWVLETTGREWAAMRRTEGTCALSNEPTIRRDFDRHSRTLWQHTTSAENGQPFDFALAVTDPGTPLQVSHLRLQRSRQLLADATERGVDVGTAKRILRDHFEDTFLGGPTFNAALPDVLTLCMHDHPAGFTWGNTASSVIMCLPGASASLPYLWWSPVTPCTGVYVPIFLHARTVPDCLSEPGRAKSSYWWRFQRLLDVVKGDELGGSFTARQRTARTAFDRLEQRWAQELPPVATRANDLLDAAPSEAAHLLAEFTESCVRQASDVLDQLFRAFG